MVNPVLRSIFGERPLPQTVRDEETIEIFIEVQQNAQTGLCRKGMSRCRRNMITARENVAFFSKAGGCQVFSGRKMRELYEFDCSERMSITIDNGKQTGACRQYRIDCVLQAPILMKFGNWSDVEIESEQLGELLDTKRVVSHFNKLKEPMSEFPVRLFDFSQGALICLV
jgi:hypothetical protein